MPHSNHIPASTRTIQCVCTFMSVDFFLFINTHTRKGVLSSMVTGHLVNKKCCYKKKKHKKKGKTRKVRKFRKTEKSKKQQSDTIRKQATNSETI